LGGQRQVFVTITRAFLDAISLAPRV